MSSEFKNAINNYLEKKGEKMKHDYKTKFNMELLKGKIVMAFTDPLDSFENYNEDMEKDNYKYFTDEFTGYGIHTYYIFNTMEEFIEKWKEIYDKPNGMWYWCLDNGVCFCSGACDPDDINIFTLHISEKREASTTDREKKQNIMANANLTDMEKLRRVFDISKNSLKEYDSQLYYAILAVLDKDKKPDVNGYFKS